MKKEIMSAWIIIVICFVISGNLYSQEERTESSNKSVNSLGLNLGVNDFHMKDNYLSPDIFSGAMFGSRIIYQHKSEETQHRVSFYFSTGQINSTEQPRDVKQYDASIVYSYLHSIYSFKAGVNPLVLFIGGGASSIFIYTNFNATDILNNYSFFDESWYWSYEADIYFRAEYSLENRYSFAWEIASPLISIVSRPENGHYFNGYNAKVNNNYMHAAVGGKPSFIWDSPILFSEIECRQRISPQFEILLDYSFKLISSDRPLPLRMYTNNLLVGIIWGF